MFNLLQSAMQSVAQVVGATGDAQAASGDVGGAATLGEAAVNGAASGLAEAAANGATPALTDAAVSGATPALTDAAVNGVGPAVTDAVTGAAPALADAAVNGVAPALAPAAAAAVDLAQGGMLHFIAQSDFVGKTLFAILILMSLVSWYLIFVKSFLNWRVRRHSARFLNEFWAASSLEQVENEIATHGATEPFAHVASHAIHARNHHVKYGALKLEEKGSTGAFVTRTIRKVIDEETARLENGLTVLASIGSTAPFVGLFGTVWGVYHALIGIGMAQGVTVNSIAGPVGEALIMTGLGLAVAIPAVLAYNAFVRGNRVYLARLDAFAHDLFTFLSTGQQVIESRAKVRGITVANTKKGA